MRSSIGFTNIGRQFSSKISKTFIAAIGAVSLLISPSMAADNDTPSIISVSASANSDNFRLNEKSSDSLAKNLENGTEADAKFRALHGSWGNNFSAPANVSLSIPSIDPVTKVDISSYYGYRTDPFKGRRKNHKGLDIRGPVGTPIYATADGFVKTSQWFSGYGNYIELDHGNAITTRYGHMSKLLVDANTRVKKGDIIGLMGSTGRSTGSHLHYEVRVAGEPLNPQSFMAAHTNDYVKLASDEDSSKAQGGPDE